MKQVFSFSFLFMFCLSIHAQVRPEGFIGLLPAIPLNVTSMNKVQQDEYLLKVNELSQQVKAEMNRRDKNIEASMQEKNKTMMKQNTINGIDPQKLAAMSEAERQAWAQSYAQQTASKQTNTASAQKQQQNSQNLYDLINKQKKLTDSLNRINTGFINEFQAIEDDTERQTALDKINAEMAEIMSKTGIVSKEESAKSDALEKQVNAEKEQYNKKYITRYTEILRRVETFTKGSIPAYYRLEKITNDISLAQNGVTISDEPGAMGISSVDGYLNLLSGIFKYKIND